MGLRGVVRDIIGVYLGIEIITGYFLNSLKVTSHMLVAAIMILLLSIWFLLERIGIAKKLD